MCLYTSAHVPTHMLLATLPPVEGQEENGGEVFSPSHSRTITQYGLSLQCGYRSQLKTQMLSYLVAGQVLAVVSVTVRKPELVSARAKAWLAAFVSCEEHLWCYPSSSRISQGIASSASRPRPLLPIPRPQSPSCPPKYYS